MVLSRRLQMISCLLCLLHQTNCILVKRGEIDILFPTKCDGPTKTMYNNEHCRCWFGKTTFYGIRNRSCSIFDGVETPNVKTNAGCTNAFEVRSKSNRNEFQMIPDNCRTLNITLIEVRDKSDGKDGHWEGRLSERIRQFIQLKTVYIMIDNMGGSLDGLLLRINYGISCNGQSEQRCTVLKVYGEREYPIVWRDSTYTTTHPSPQPTTMSTTSNQFNSTVLNRTSFLYKNIRISNASSNFHIFIGLLASVEAVAIIIILVVFVILMRRKKKQRRTDVNGIENDGQQTEYAVPENVLKNQYVNNGYEAFKKGIDRDSNANAFVYDETGDGPEYKELPPEYNDIPEEYKNLPQYKDLEHPNTDLEYKELEKEPYAALPAVALPTLTSNTAGNKPAIPKKPMLPPNYKKNINNPTFTTFIPSDTEDVYDTVAGTEDVYDIVADTSTINEFDKTGLYAQVHK